jgi:hypothetical protein
VTHFALIDAQFNVEVPGYQVISSNVNIPIGDVPFQVSLRAYTTIGVAVSSVDFYVDGSFIYEDTAEPFAIAGDNGNGNYFFYDEDWQVGDTITIKATPFVDDTVTLVEGGSLEVVFTLVA